MKRTRVTHHRRPRLLITAAVLAIVGLLIPFSQIASAGTVARSVAGSGPKPSIVLVHGAWADSSSWDAVVSRLQHDGYTVYVPPNPLLGLNYDPAFIAPFTKETETGRMGLAGWGSPVGVVTFDAPQNRREPGWLSFGFAITWGGPVRKAAVTPTGSPATTPR